MSQHMSLSDQVSSALVSVSHAHFDKAQFDVTRSTDGEVEKLRVLKYNTCTKSIAYNFQKSSN